MGYDVSYYQSLIGVAYGFRLVPTLNDLEQRNSPYFAFFHGIR